MSAARFPLAASWTLAILIVLLHAAAAAAVALVLPGIAGIALACALFVLGLAAAWSRALHRGARSVRALELEGTQVVLELANGARLGATMGERRYVSRFFVALQVKRPFRRTLLITRDMLDADLFRSLRIWALWGRLPGVAAPQLRA